ncbi:MAG: extensin family protein [Deltaproteobacteria bacterium]|nr:extensin family protein [Deltaproteobacteria bacterium]
MRLGARSDWPAWATLLGICALGCGISSEPAPRPAHPGSRIAATDSDESVTSPSADTVATPKQHRDPVAATTAVPEQTSTLEKGLANLNPDDDEVVGPPEVIADCEPRLQAAGVTYRPAHLPIVRKQWFVCGSPQVVEYIEGPEHIRYRTHPLVTCQLALALAHFERVLNRSAKELLGAQVVSVTQGGTYSCRSMARFRMVSEHSYANAIDLYAFGLSDARTLSVLEHFGAPKNAATTPEGRFLRTLAQRLFDENVFSVVVTRFFDELHRDHIHVDMAHYRTDGSR